MSLFIADQMIHNQLRLPAVNNSEVKKDQLKNESKPCLLIAICPSLITYFISFILFAVLTMLFKF